MKSNEILNTIKHTSFICEEPKTVSMIFPDEIKEIEKSLKALEIIKKNRYEAVQCLAYDIYEDYIIWYNNFAKVEPPITREEYELLKEVWNEK